MNGIRSHIHLPAPRASLDHGFGFSLKDASSNADMLVAGRNSPVNRHDIAPAYPSWDAFVESWRHRFSLARFLIFVVEPDSIRVTANLTAYRHERITTPSGKQSVMVLFPQDSVLARDIIKDLDDATPEFIREIVIVSHMIPPGRRKSKYGDRRIIMVVPPGHELLK